MIENEKKIKKLIMSEYEENHNLGMVLLCSHDEINKDVFSRIIFDCVINVISDCFKDSMTTKYFYSKYLNQWVYVVKILIIRPLLEIRFFVTQVSDDGIKWKSSGCFMTNSNVSFISITPLKKIIVGDFYENSIFEEKLREIICNFDFKQYTSLPYS